jgi:hypothetical protein
LKNFQYRGNEISVIIKINKSFTFIEVMEKLSSNDLPKNQKKYPYITARESEVDSIVVEEIFCSKDFQNYLLSKMSLKDNSELIGAWKNIMPTNFGECDIVIEFIENNKKLAILIEDKIDAPEQPQQAERYHKTGKLLVQEGKIDQYISCLLCPKDYFKEGAPMEKYDKKITYEELLEYFEQQENSKRIQFKKMILQNGIIRAKTGYMQNIDEKTNNFYQYYEGIGRKNNPELEFQYKKPFTKDQSWVDIKPEMFSKNIKIIHKGDRGFVDLQISKIDIDEFRKFMQDKLREGMTIHNTGKSFSVRILVSKLPQVSSMEKFEMYGDQIADALNAASRLMQWYLDFKNESIFR